AERAARGPARDPTRGGAPWAGEVTDGALGGRAQAPAGLSPRPDWQLRLSACGARRAAARAPPRAPPVTGRPPSRPPSAPTLGRPSSRRPSLEPTKITVKSAPACGLRVLRMALRATL